jgi:phosphoglycerate dehydrogenase-like enzyme
MPRILGISHTESDAAKFFTGDDLDRLRAAYEVRILGGAKSEGFRDRMADVEMLLGSWGVPKLDAGLLAAAPRLRAVCYAAGSVKGFVTPESYRRSVQVTTAMYANALPVVEWTLAVMTLAAKNAFRSMDRIRAGGRDAFWGPEPVSHGLFGATIGIIGFGAIGRMVCERLRDFDVRVLVHDPYAPAHLITAAGGVPCGLDRLAAESRIVSLHAPDIPATHGMINAAFLARMPDRAVFINTARGRLVDEAALIAELEKGRLDAYLDVTHPEPPAADSPLYRLPNCWLTPHRAGSHGEEVRRMGRLAIDECLRFAAGRPFRFPVSEAMLATMA